MNARDIGIARGMKSTAAPWRALKESQSDYIAEEKYMPAKQDGGYVTLEDPSKMSKNDIHECLERWQNFQTEGKIPLQFSHYLTYEGERLPAKLYETANESRSPRKKRKRGEKLLRIAGSHSDSPPSVRSKKARRTRRMGRKGAHETSDEGSSAAESDEPAGSSAEDRTAEAANTAAMPDVSTLLQFPSSSNSSDSDSDSRAGSANRLDADDYLHQADDFDYSTLDPELKAISAVQEAMRLQAKKEAAAAKDPNPSNIQYPVETHEKAAQLGITEHILARSPQLMELVHRIVMTKKAAEDGRHAATARANFSTQERAMNGENSTLADSDALLLTATAGSQGGGHPIVDKKAAEEKEKAEGRRAAAEKEQAAKAVQQKKEAVKKRIAAETKLTAGRELAEKKAADKKLVAEKKAAKKTLAAEKHLAKKEAADRTLAAEKKAAEKKASENAVAVNLAAEQKKAALNRETSEARKAAAIMKQLIHEKAAIDAEIREITGTAADGGGSGTDTPGAVGRNSSKPRRATSETAKVRAARLDAEEKAAAKVEAQRKAALKAAANSNHHADAQERPRPRPIRK